MSFLGGLSRKRSNNGKSKTPFPSQQLFILALCRICEPIAFMSIFPYIYYMIESFDITKDATKIAIYAGMVTSSFALAEFSTSIIWGRLSDRIGRKPVLLGGLAGTIISMIIFGFSTNLPMALLGRALGGFLNGNIAVLQTTVAELVTVKEHQPRAYSIMPFVWCLGAILGPALGGALAQPVKNLPSIFYEGTIFETYPFLLSNLVCVAILCCGLIIGTLFLKETHSEFKNKPDAGIRIGNWIISLFKHQDKQVWEEKLDELLISEESEQLLSDGSFTQQPPPHSCYQSSDSLETRTTKTTKPLTSGKAWTRPVVMNIIAYGLIAYHAISFDQMMPIFLSSPITQDSKISIFQFSGGFGFSSKFVGMMLAIQGIYSLFAQLLLFPYAIQRWGPLKTFRATIMIWPLLYIIVPYLVFLPKQLQTAGIMFCLTWRITAQCLAFPAMQLLIANAVPSMLLLGTVNGVAASTASLARAFGPTLSGSLFSFGLSIGYVGLAWWVAAGVALLGAFQSLWMTEGKGRLDTSEDEKTPDLAEQQ